MWSHQPQQQGISNEKVLNGNLEVPGLEIECLDDPDRVLNPGGEVFISDDRCPDPADIFGRNTPGLLIPPEAAEFFAHPLPLICHSRDFLSTLFIPKYFAAAEESLTKSAIKLFPGGFKISDQAASGRISPGPDQSEEPEGENLKDREETREFFPLIGAEEQQTAEPDPAVPQDSGGAVGYSPRETGGRPVKRYSSYNFTIETKDPFQPPEKLPPGDRRPDQADYNRPQKRPDHYPDNPIEGGYNGKTLVISLGHGEEETDPGLKSGIGETERSGLDKRCAKDNRQQEEAKPPDTLQVWENKYKAKQRQNTPDQSTGEAADRFDIDGRDPGLDNHDQKRDYGLHSRGPAEEPPTIEPGQKTNRDPDGKL